MIWQCVMFSMLCKAAFLQGENAIIEDPDKIVNDINAGNGNGIVNDYSAQDLKNGEILQGETMDIANNRNDAPIRRKTKICLDRRGDCKSVLQYCSALKGLCDKSCGYCKGILGHKDTFVFGLEKVTVKKGNLVARIPYMGKEYSVNFDFFPTEFGPGPRSVIHFTASNRNSAARGDQYPAIWLHLPSSTSLKNRFLICSDVSGNRAYCLNTNTFINKNQWVNVSISQKKVFGGYYYSIHIDGHVIYTMRNTSPAVFRRVYVYAGSPWHTAAEGTIKNLVIKTSE